MELTPQLLTDEIDFRIAVRGYDRNEVDDFLERVAVAVGQLQAQLSKAVSRAKAAEKRLAELDAPGSPGTLLPSREQPAVVVAPPEPEKASTPAVAALDARVDNVEEAPMPGMPDLHRLVNRSDGAVRAV